MQGYRDSAKMSIKIQQRNQLGSSYSGPDESLEPEMEKWGNKDENVGPELKTD